MAFTLISVSRVDQAGFSLLIKGGICKIRASSSKVIGYIPLNRGLYQITNSKSPSKSAHFANLADRQISINDLHQQMGHVNHDNLH